MWPSKTRKPSKKIRKNTNFYIKETNKWMSS